MAEYLPGGPEAGIGRDPSAYAERTIDERCRRSFEAARRAGSPALLEQFVPADGSPFYLATLEELVCIDMEFAWKEWARQGGWDPRNSSRETLRSPELLEGYLARFPVLRNGANVRRLVEHECLVRVQAGFPVSESEYRQRFPDDLPLIAAAFQDASASNAAAGPGATSEEPAWQLNEYLLLHEIGRGGMGVVYKARHRKMKRLVAVKVLPPGSMNSPEAIKRFYHEVEAAARLSHPNIVTAYDAGEHEGTHYLVMEYVDGQDLARTVQERGPLPVGEAVDYVLQAAEGLAYAHGEGIIHRDIKPGNLLLDRRGQIKILDMGLARIQAAGPEAPTESSRPTASGQLMGTCDYMAPEQAEDIRGTDHRADIYSLGCTLYCLLTGAPPYSCATIIQTLVAHRESPIPCLRAARPDVPESLESVARKMMAKRPEDRYQTMVEVVADLKACFSGPASVAPPGIPEREEDVAPSSFNATLAAVGGGAVGLAVLLVLLVLWGGRSNPEDKGSSRAPVQPEGPPPLAAAPLDAGQAKQHQHAWAEYLGTPVETANSIGMKLVLIPPGEFQMGSTQEEIDRLVNEARKGAYETTHIENLPGEGPRHRVRITRPFWLGAREVTVGQFRRFVEDTNYDAETYDAGATWKNAFPSQTEDHPVTGISWNDAARFCEWLSGKEGEHYRLPTEAEWEYACRAGTQSSWSFGDNESGFGKNAWFNQNSSGQTHAVGLKSPNAWGLSDMHGNVLEFCADAYGANYYASAPSDDPQGPSSEDARVLRGGSWYAAPGDSRCAFRLRFAPDYRDNYCGFRAARSLQGW